MKERKSAVSWETRGQREVRLGGAAVIEVLHGTWAGGSVSRWGRSRECDCSITRLLKRRRSRRRKSWEVEQFQRMQHMTLSVFVCLYVFCCVFGWGGGVYQLSYCLTHTNTVTDTRALTHIHGVNTA